MEYKIVTTTEKVNGRINQSYQEQHHEFYINGSNVKTPKNPKVRQILEDSKRLLTALGLRKLEVVAELEG